MSVKPVETVGDGLKKLPVVCQNEKGETLLHAIFKEDTLIEYAQQHVGEEIDADVRTSTRPNPNSPDPYVNRTITQIYVDGQPLLKRQQRGRGGFAGGISFEAAQVISDGLQKAAAIKELGNIIGLSLSDNEESDRDLYLKTVRSMLTNPTPTAPLAQDAQNSSKPHQPGNSSTGATTGSKNADNSSPVKHWGDLLTRANKLNVLRPEVETIAKKVDPNINLQSIPPETLKRIWDAVQAQAAATAESNEAFENL